MFCTCQAVMHIRLVAGVVVAALVGVGAESASAQLVPLRQRAARPQPQTTTVSGKLVEIAKKGRLTLLTIETGDEEKKQFPLTPRTDFAITARGDDGFLRKGVVVGSTPVASNQRLFGKAFIVHLTPRKPKPYLKKSKPEPGASKNTWRVVGQIVSRQRDDEYPEYEVLTLRLVGRRTVNVFMDKGYSVVVRMANPEKAEPGASVSVTGRQGPRNRFLVTAVNIRLQETLKAEEFFGRGDKDDKEAEAEATDE